jgi:type IV pilus assembly protein PilB
MPITEEVRNFILHGASSVEIKQQSIKEVMNSLRMSGLIYLRSGVTTIEEVLRVTAAD